MCTLPCQKDELNLEKRVEFGQIKRREGYFRRGDGEPRRGDGNREGRSVRQLQTNFFRDKCCGLVARDKTRIVDWG